MSNIAVGNGGRGGAATAITVVQILMASPAILTTDAFAAPISNKDCKDTQFRALESSSYSTKAGNTITIGTSQDVYSVKID